MTEKYKILGKYIKDMSSETKDIETYIYVRERITKYQLGIDILYIPFIGTFSLGIWYIPFAVFVIVSFANAVNITDGLDGLASGVLMISLFGLWFLSASILDVPLSLFLSLWIGSLVSFLYL